MIWYDILYYIIWYEFYLLQFCFQTLAAVGKLVQKYE